MKLARITVVSIIVGALAASCGSGSKSGTGGSAGSGGSGGSAGSGGTQGSGGSAGSGGTHGSGGTMGSPPKDSGPEDAMPEGGKICKMLATHDECKKCCINKHPKGHKAFVGDELTCVCTAALCGPGGTAGVDSGMFGDESCTDSCGAAKPLPLSPHCGVCVDKAMGSVPKPGMCRPMVKTACDADMACKEYLDCIDGCPP